MKNFQISNRNRVRRIPPKAAYSKKMIYAIVDEALYCNIGILHDDKPIVIPTIHARMRDDLVFHGSNASRLIKMSNENELCVTITLLDGLVLARSLFHSSLNYRSVVLFGKGEIISDVHERWEAFKAITEQITPGRWNDARQPNEIELKQTTILKMHIDEASAKISSKTPKDDDDDYQLNYWAGVIPITQTYGDAVTDPLLKKGIHLPEYLKNYKRD